MKNYLYILCIIPALTIGQEIPAIETNNPGIAAILCSTENYNGEPLEKEWVEKDIENIHVLNRLYTCNGNFDEMLLTYPALKGGHRNVTVINYDCGYGLTSTICEMYGGYGNCTISILRNNDHVLKIRFTVPNERRLLQETLFSTAHFPLECRENWIMYEKKYSENINKYIATVDKLVLDSDDINQKRREAIDYFTNVSFGSLFQEPFYTLSGVGHNTFEYVRYFIVNKDYEAMENILYSPSPTSRLVLAKTLEYMQKHYRYKPSSKIITRIKEVLRGQTVVRSGVPSCWIDKFDYDYYDLDKNFEVYLKTE